MPPAPSPAGGPRRAPCARRACALGRPQLLVHADDEVADDLLADPQPPLDLLHQLAGAVDQLEDVDAFLVRANLVGQLAAAPVLGLLELAADAGDDGLDLRVQVGDLLLGRVGRDDVDEFVLSGTCS